MLRTRRDFLRLAGLAATWGSIGRPARFMAPVASRLTGSVEGPDPSEFQSLAEAALDAARKVGATYADIRIARSDDLQYAVDSDQTGYTNSSRTCTYSVRALAGGGIGYAASENVT